MTVAPDATTMPQHADRPLAPEASRRRDVTAWDAGQADRQTDHQEWCRTLIRIAIGSKLEVAQKLTDMMIREIPSVSGTDAQAHDMLLESVHSNVSAIYDIFDTGSPSEEDTAPDSALAYSRFLAQRKVPLTALLRAYRLGHARFLSQCLETAEQLNLPGRPLATVAFVDRCAAYIDHVAEEVGTAYEQERERWISRRSVRRQRWVGELLAGQDVDVDEASLGLGYDLCRTHVALEAWLPVQASLRGDDAFDTLLSALGGIPSAKGHGLLVPIDDRDVRLWVPVDPERFDPVDVIEEVSYRNLPVKVAIGAPCTGADGFRRSHRQALAARRAMEIAEDPPQGLSFQGIGPVALLCHDLDGLRDWVQSVLGSLAHDDERSEWLRDTLYVFLETGGSFAAASEKLIIHRNTVQYRVQQAIETRGWPLDEDRYDTYLALRVCRWLGAQALPQGRGTGAGDQGAGRSSS